MTLFEIIGLILFIIFQLLLIYSISFSRKKAESYFNQSLEKYKSELIGEVGQKFIEQKGNIDKEIANNQAKLINEISKQFIEQKRDIDKEITNLRGDIDKDISHLQSDLQLITNQKNNFLNEKRDALVGFYSNYTHWLSTILNCTPDSMVFKNALEISHSYQQKMDEALMKCEIASGKLDLYVQDNELTKLRNNLFDNTYKLHDNIAVCILEIRDMWLEVNRDGVTEEEANEMEDIFDGFDKKRRNIYDKVKPTMDKIQAKITAILNEILK